LVVLSKLHYAANATAPLNKLPPELLHAIFSYLCPETHRNWDVERTSPYEDLLAVTHVCRHWRDIAVSATGLWTYIILAAGFMKGEISIAQLCMRRSGVQPLDLFYTLSPVFVHPGCGWMLPDSRRLRSAVYGYVGESSGDELVSFFRQAPYLERLEIRGSASFPLPTLFSGTTPRLRELTISRCTPWPNNQFGSLTALNLLLQKDVVIHSLLDALRRSPHLEELLLGREFQPDVEPQQTPEPHIPAVPLHSLKRLHICRFSAATARRLLGAFDLIPNGIFMQFTNVSADLGAIFQESIAPRVSPRAATKLELIYPRQGGVIIHATNGAAHTRLAYRLYPECREFLHWTAETPHEEHPLKELWLHIENDCYEVPPPHALRNLERLVIETTSTEFDLTFFPMLSPSEDSLPSPLLSTLELRKVFGVKMLGGVLKARMEAGSRLKTLRIRWFGGCEARMAPLARFVEELEFYRVADETSRGLELPNEPTTGTRWREPWSRTFVGNMEDCFR